MLLSLDISSAKTGYAFLEEKSGEISVLKSGVIFTKLKAGQTYYRVGDIDMSIDRKFLEVFDLFWRENFNLFLHTKEVIIESPIFRRNHRVAIITGIVHGFVRSFLSRFSFERVGTMDNKSWKAIYCHHGGAKKTYTKDLVESEYNIKALTDDESDAIAMGTAYFIRKRDEKNDNK